MRFRITVRNEDIELRGYIDVETMENLYGFSNAMKGIGMVVASPAADDYNPFRPPDYDVEESVPPEWAGQ